MVRVRFAPSPTGFLHIGNVRTALFNWLFAKHEKGVFILRIEDTDKERSEERFTQAILDSLKWLGMDYQEGPKIGGPKSPYFQSQRLDIYGRALATLQKNNQVYPCFCTPDELAAKRAEMAAKKLPPRYDGQCRSLPSAEAEKRIANGERFVWRFKVEPGMTSFEDMVHGLNQVDHKEIDDFVLMKSDGGPAFNFACAVDDGAMEITHVIRGDDHLSNTPRQILLHQALGQPVPRYAHLPQILGPDKKRLSKRHGATLVTEYRELGYLPEVLVNYLSLLGWSTSDSQQLFSLSELIEKFTLERVGKNPAIFDQKKLDWMNGVYIRQMPQERLYQAILPMMQERKLVSDPITEEQKKLFLRLLDLERERIQTFQVFPEFVDYFFRDDYAFEESAEKKWLENEVSLTQLKELQARLARAGNFNKEEAEQMVRQYAEELKVKPAQLIHPLRVSLTGRTIGPGLFDIMELLGKEKCVQRIQRVLQR